MKQNYQKLMEEEIAKISSLEQKPSLLLHVCCAPCSSAVLEVLKGHFEITLFFYNPNISPKNEFDFRLSELERLLSETDSSNIKIVTAEYNDDEFISMVKGREKMPEGGTRCFDCYSLRLKRTAAYAKENGFDYFCTTLSVSPHKNSEWLNSIGEALSKEYGIKYLFSDFKKKEGYKRSIELSRIHSFYRQNYCGCRYSRKED